jgi:hypothetical protein
MKMTLRSRFGILTIAAVVLAAASYLGLGARPALASCGPEQCTFNGTCYEVGECHGVNLICAQGPYGAYWTSPCETQ